MENKNKSSGTGSLTGAVFNAVSSIGKSLEKDMDKYVDNLAVEVKPPITFDKCIEYAKQVKAKHPEVAAVFLGVENVEKTAQQVEHVIVNIGFKDSNGKVLPDKGTKFPMGTMLRVESIDMKFLDYLKGNNSITITF